MVDFHEVVRQAQRRGATANLQPVVEKEILHHEILRCMAEAGLLRHLTFIGGTCLRACYGSSRLSEDLDFTGGTSFRREDLADLGALVARGVHATYGLTVLVGEPQREGGNVDTWHLQMVTHPGSRHLPQQRIHIDICAVSSEDRHPTVLQNHYGVDLGTSGLIVQAESQREILADKILALAMRPNRVKQRDLWDIAWLVQQGASPDPAMVDRKCLERRIASEVFRDNLAARLAGLATGERAFQDEMSRFLPQATRKTSIDQPGFWTYLTRVVRQCAAAWVSDGEVPSKPFQM